MPPLSFHHYTAICGEEFKESLAKELGRLGAADIEPGFKAVHFTADLATAYKIHLKSALPSRILQVQRQGAAANLKAVFFQALKVHWSELIKPGSTYLVEGIAGDRGPDAPKSNDLSKKVREAIEAHHAKRGLALPRVDLKEPDVVVVAYYYGRKIAISVVTSGKSMHKRGYKLDSHPAPVKENVASALLEMAGYDGSQVFYDPMCGSGTLAIEAAFRSLDKAPLIHRKKGEFGLEKLHTFDKDLWRRVQDELRDIRLKQPKAPLFASDMDPVYVKMTRRHALRARVERYIDLYQSDFFTGEPPAPEGLMVVNLPYGSRLGEKKELEDFYKAFGDKLKQSYSGWQCAVLAAEDAPWKNIGLHAHRRFRVLNGGIPCRFLLYKLYQGSRKQKKIAQA